jgi:hypothetical protein
MESLVIEFDTNHKQTLLEIFRAFQVKVKNLEGEQVFYDDLRGAVNWVNERKNGTGQQGKSLTQLLDEIEQES